MIVEKIGYFVITQFIFNYLLFLLSDFSCCLSSLAKNVLVGCQRYGLKVCEFLRMGQSAFHGNAFRKLYSKNNIDDVEP